MEIELAGKTIGRIRQSQKAKRLLDKLIIWGALFLSLVLIVIAGLNLKISQSNQKLNNRIKAAQKQIADSAKIETQQAYLNAKLASFGGLVKTHELHQAVAETIFNLIPSGTSLKGFEVSETGVLSLSGSVPDWQLLSQLMSNLDKPTGPLTVKSYQLKKIDFSSAGISFNLELILKI